MARRLVLGLGLAAGVALTAVGCDNKSSPPASSPAGPGVGSDEYKKAMGGNKAPRDADKRDDTKSESTKK